MRRLEHRIQTLEATRASATSNAPASDAELLGIVAPEHTGPMPSRAELGAMSHAWLTRPALDLPNLPAGLSAQEHYMQMLKPQAGPTKAPHQRQRQTKGPQ